MDRAVSGNLTIGGRGSNRNFHGRVASFVTTTLLVGVAMPTDAEIDLMVTDPNKWMDDYKVGQNWRRNEYQYTYNNWQKNAYTQYIATQVWLMGDGANDSYSNMIRNQAGTSDQNYTKLNLISMVSNDIQTVNKNGLT